MDKPDTPMIDKAVKLEQDNLLLVRFLTWLARERGLALCQETEDPHDLAGLITWQSIPMKDHEGLVADFQGIDLKQVAAERRKLVKWANGRGVGDGLGEGRTE
jgi:hypothetical protein